MKISLIVPVYGVEKYIARCYQSIISQTCQDFELIFVIDCSKDKSEEILLEMIAKYPHPNIKVIRHQVNAGISATRETGINAATGEYVLYIDSDDYIAEDMIELMLTEAYAAKADIVYCDYYTVKNATPTYTSQFLSLDDPLQITAAMIRQDIVWAPWNKVIRRAMFVEHEVHWPKGVNVGEDMVVITQLFSRANKIGYINKALYFYNRDNVNSYLNVWNSHSCAQNMNAVKLLSAYIDQYFKSTILLTATMQLKLMARFQMIYSLDSQLHMLAGASFPETNPLILSYKKSPHYWRWILYLSSHHQSRLSSTLLTMIRSWRNLRNMVRN